MKLFLMWTLVIIGFIAAVQFWVYTMDMHQRVKAQEYYRHYSCVVKNYGHIPGNEPYPLCD